MKSRSLLPVVLLTLASVPASAAMYCSLTAVPLQVNIEGLAEPTGDIYLNCSGGTPNGVLSGTLQISVGSRIANSITGDDQYVGIAISQEISGSFHQLPIQPRAISTYIVFEALNVNLNANGGIGLKVSGIRAEGSEKTQAAIQFYGGNQQLLVLSPLAVIAAGQPGLYATALPATVAGPGVEVPASLDFGGMVASHAQVASVRVTEGFAAAFAPRQADMTNGTRILIQISGLPNGSRVFAPNAVSGNNSSLPTQSGQFGTPLTSGFYNTFAGSSLLLARVAGAGSDGSGGWAIALPGTGPQNLYGAGEVLAYAGSAQLLYEVVDSSTTQVENAQIPLWIFTPANVSVDFSIVRPQVSLAPLGGQAGTGGASSLPRYRGSVPVSDCGSQGDCAAYYFPHMGVAPSGLTAFTAASGGNYQVGYIVVANGGTALLEWQAKITYGNGAGWLSVSPTTGLNNSTARYDVNPKNLAQGHYEAKLTFEQTHSPTSVTTKQDVTVTLDVSGVVAPPPPVVPAPRITAVLDAASGNPIDVAPGSLIILKGSGFLTTTAVTIAGRVAEVVSVTADQMAVVVPIDTPVGVALVIAANEGSASAAFGFNVVALAPSIATVLNYDDSLNGEGSAAPVGTQVKVFTTGLRLAELPVQVKIHDRYLDAYPATTDRPGINVLRVDVPADLPAMQSWLTVCGKLAGAEPVCADARPVWLGFSLPPPPPGP